jgi:uncharacterized protein (UPF0276 family)
VAVPRAAAVDAVEEAAGVAGVAAAGAEMMNAICDTVGIGWRPELAAGILYHRDRIDLIEVIADDFFDEPRHRRALKTLSGQVPVVLHGVGLGLASASVVETWRIERMARLVDSICPVFWSEHLAFVRAEGIEIGHLVAPPRSDATVEGAAENLLRAARIVGVKPFMENIATLIEPPGSTLDEASWISKILSASGCDLLLDLHNVFANGLNHGYDTKEFLRQIPAGRIRTIHIAGGKLVSAPDGTQRVLDDHLHDVPDSVFDLLEEAAALSPNPVSVILERDGSYPSMESLLAQVSQARRALARGRTRRVERVEVLT